MSYSTWGPNNVNIDLAAQHIMSLDDFYLVPLYDGNIVGMSPSSTKSRPGQWGGHISSAVINVFDLLRTNTGSESEPLVLLPQPPYVDLTLDIDEMDTFIERTDTGEWFALSAKYFPSLVKDAPEAPWTLGKGDLSTEISLQRSLIGVHRVEEPLGIGRLGRGGGAVIGSPLDGSHHIGVSSTSVPLAIAPPSQRYPQIHPVETRPSSAYSRDSMIYGPQPQLPPSKLSSWWSIIGRMIENVISVFLLIVLVVVGSRMGWLPQLVELLESILVRNNKSNNELEKLGGFRVNVDSVDTEENESQQLSASNIPSDSKTVMESSILQENTSSLKTDDRSYQPQNLVNGKESSRHVTIVEPEQTIAVSPTAPKKRKRGSRGGRKNRSDKDKNNVVDTNSSSQSLTKESEESNPSETQISSTNSSSPESGSTAHLGGLQSNGMAILSKEPIGYGSHGTLVYKGTFENREVAIKRVLLSFYDIASQEVALLQESDDHANVIRYYRMCREDEFLYIALELCPGSLHDIIEHPYDPKFETLLPRMNPIQVLYQIASGVNHLHLLKIVHRDIKPQNILVAPPKVIHTRSADGQVKESLGPIRMLISDFGLCKKLEGEQTSFRATTAQAAGTTGWTAPEIILARRSNYDNEHGSNCSSSLRESVNSDLTVDLGNRRLTRAVDIFSLGCVFYYTLTNGKHPFGSDTKRDGNVEENMFSLEELDDHDVPNNVEAQDLITKMISHDPRDRPEASSVLLHPLFWSFQKKLDFLLKFSDRFEADTREDYSELLTLFEKHAPEVVGKDWHLALDKPFVENLGKYRKYHGDRIIDLLRAMRNKCHHFNELPSGLQHLMGPVPDGYLLYFTKRFPLLLMTVYDFAKEHLSEENGFQVYFTPQEQH